MWLYEQTVKKLKSQWKTQKQAEWITKKSFETYGIFKKWTLEYTDYWRKRAKMTKSERLIDRASRNTGRPKHHYKLVRWKVKLKNLYKRIKRRWLV